MSGLGILFLEKRSVNKPSPREGQEKIAAKSGAIEVSHATRLDVHCP
jgi:hypothetical protein